MQEFEIGQKVEVKETDTKGNIKWSAGEIAAIKFVENHKKRLLDKTFVINVGKGKKIGERTISPRAIEINRRLSERVQPGEPNEAVFKEILKEKDLPKEGEVTEPILEYRTVEATADDLQAIR